MPPGLLYHQIFISTQDMKPGAPLHGNSWSSLANLTIWQIVQNLQLSFLHSCITGKNSMWCFTHRHSTKLNSLYRKKVINIGTYAGFKRSRTACTLLVCTPRLVATVHTSPSPAAHHMDVALLSATDEPPRNHLAQRRRSPTGRDSCGEYTLDWQSSSQLSFLHQECHSPPATQNE